MSNGIRLTLTEHGELPDPIKFACAVYRALHRLSSNEMVKSEWTHAIANVGFFPMEMTLGTSPDGYHVFMILKLKDPQNGPDHRVGFKLRFQEKGGSVYGVHIHSNMPELTIDLDDESSYSLFSDAIFNRVMSRFSTDGEDDLDIQPTGVPN